MIQRYGPLLVLVALLAVMLGTCELLWRAVPFFRAQSDPKVARRFAAIDGLRGYLASVVFVCHLVMFRQWILYGSYTGFPVPWLTMAASIGVSWFFMITALLFWTKAMERGGKIDPLELFRSRWWRLAPLYGVMVLAVLLEAAAYSRFERREPVLDSLRTILRIGSFGYWMPPWLNGVYILPMLGVVWTLWYEWVFYLTLPCTAMAVPLRRALLIPVVLFAAQFASGFMYLSLPFTSFLGGIFTAYLVRSPRWRALASRWWMGFVPIASVWIAHWIADVAYRPQCVVPLGVGFAVIAGGNDVFGLLRLRSARALGLMSYSVYLLHGLVFYPAMTGFNRIYRFDTAGPKVVMAMYATVGVLVVLVSAAAYRWFEHPYLHRGKPARKPVSRTALPAAELDAVAP